MIKHSKITWFRPPVLVAFAILVYLVLFNFISFWKYQNFQYDGLDLAIINQVYYNSAHGNWFASSIHPPSYLGDHVSPIILVLLPLYWLWQNPQMLLLLQTLALGLSAWPIYLIAKKLLGKNWAGVVAVAWLANPFVQNINLFEFHDLVFAIPLLLWAYYFYQNNKYAGFLITLGAALLVREDVALVTAGFALLALVQKKSWRWWIWPLVLSLGYFFLAVSIGSWAAPGQHYKFLIYYAWLGNSWAQIITNSLLHPHWLLFKLLSPGSVVVALGLLLSVAYLPLAQPLYLLLSAPIYFQLVLGSDSNWLATILFTQYSALLLPGLMVAAIYGAKQLQQADFSTVALPKLFNFITKQLVLVTAFSAIVFSSLVIGPVPSSFKKIYQQGLMSNTTMTKQALLSQIPKTASVAATFELLTPLSSRANLASLNYVFLGKQQFLTADYSLPSTTEYLLVDFSDFLSYQLLYHHNGIYEQSYEHGLDNWPKIFENFGLINIKNNLGLFKKNTKNQFTLFTVVPHSYPTDQPDPIVHRQPRSVDDTLKFVGYNVNQGYFEMFWEYEQKIPLVQGLIAGPVYANPKNYYLQFLLKKNNRSVYQTLYPLGYGWLDSRSVPVYKFGQTNYWFNPADEALSGNYDLEVNLIRVNTGAIEIDGDRSTKDVIDSQIILVPKLITEKINL